MKNKPIKEAYKFFVLATKSGYIVNFTPDGWRSVRLRNTPRSTRGNHVEVFDVMMMGTFCLAMDNYFTLPKVIATLCEKGIEVVGTARYRSKNWPPTELKTIKKECAQFINLFGGRSAQDPSGSMDG